MTPNDGLIIAINNVPKATAKDQTASPCISIEPIVVVNPFALRKRYAYHAGKTATVTDVSNADLAQS
jgi:hypothetical protein